MTDTVPTRAAGLARCWLGVLLATLLPPGFARADEGRGGIDFSTCGYRQSSAGIPLVPAVVVVAPGDGDDTARLQAAVDHAGTLELGADGFRGAVLLAPGEFEIAGQIVLGQESGVVLRGSGVSHTTITATGPDRRALIRVAGAGDLATGAGVAQRQVVGGPVPAGATLLTLDSTEGLEAGTRVLVTRPSTAEWIAALGMDREGIAWKPGTRDIRWERTIVAVDRAADTVELDAPVTTSIEAGFGGAQVATYTWPGRAHRIGIENLTLVSRTDPGRPLDEDHAWSGITMENVADAWVRRVTFRGFAGSAVALWESSSRITVRDCASLAPVSEPGGYRRHTFFTAGQQSLFIRCYAEDGRRDYSVGHAAAGPNAFVACESVRALGFSGPLESWASGVLYDNVRIDGPGLDFSNHWWRRQGSGWTAANCLVWQSQAAEVRMSSPPGATNRATGVWARCSGDGEFSQLDEFVSPRSLFVAQLADRLGPATAAEHLGPVGRKTFGATNPSYAEAAEMVADSDEPDRSIREIVDALYRDAPLDADPTGLPGVDAVAAARHHPADTGGAPTAWSLSLRDGQWFAGDAPLRGKRFTPVWWRGNTRPGEAPRFGPAITRFVPGREGPGFTDDLEETAAGLASSGVAVVEHHHGLWYDRRRDDHLRHRRADGAVTPPFYEQPFARSGEGTAWDGLSRYDLTRFNPWYWNRLADFASHAGSHGLVLFQQHYFQHNVLEAGAHWADFPWRRANNINDTGFPEPPPYASDKRIFQAHLFYDVTHPRRRELHELYIRKCLENFRGHGNVVHSIGAEFTGPLEFAQFWVDTIAAWEAETGHDAVVGLSCTKDVQDSILADPQRAAAVSLIDIRQWWYTPDGGLYAPEGGKNLSPRQHSRQLRPKAPSEESKRRAVQEYRTRFPDKAVWFNGAPLP